MYRYTDILARSKDLADLARGHHRDPGAAGEALLPSSHGQWATKKKNRGVFLRKGASWRRMLVQQPACMKLRFIEHFWSFRADVQESLDRLPGQPRNANGTALWPDLPVRQDRPTRAHTATGAKASKSR